MIQPIKFAYPIKRVPYKNTLKNITQAIFHSSNIKKADTCKYVIPFVATPLVAYNIKSDENKRNLSQALEKGKAHTPITDNTEANTKALRKAGYSKKDISRELDKDGNLKNEDTKRFLDSKNISHKGASSDAYESQGEDLGQYGTTDISDGGSYADIAPDIPVMGSAGIGIEGDEVFGQLETMTDMLDNPLLEGVAAELLPGTKFLKPIKDLTDGDVSGAAVRTGTRAGEMIVAPVKLSWAAFGALAGSVSWLAGNRGEGTGLIGGFKQASKMWANGRNKIENAILDREDFDPDSANNKRIQERNDETKKIIENLKTRNQQAIDNERKNRDIILEKIRKEKEEAQNYYNYSQLRAENAKDEARQTINRNNANIAKHNQYLRDLIAEKEANLKYQRETIANIEMRLNTAAQREDERLTKELKKQKEEMIKIFKAQSAAALGDLNYIFEIINKTQEIYQKNNAKGFASIAGYDNIKNELVSKFGVPFIRNQKNPEVKVPSVITLYGPKGTGKSLFGKAMAKQFNCCDGGSMLLYCGDDLNFNKLMKIANDAKKQFEKDGKRTIIQIDEIEFFGPNQTKSFWKGLKKQPQTFEEFLAVCPEKYGCTIVATTNNPEKIDDSIKKFMIPIYVPTATKQDMAEILKFHVNNRNKGPIDYDKLAQLLTEKMTNGRAFTNARLENIVDKVITTHEKITQELLEQEIADRLPDISKEEIDVYKRGF